MVDREVFDRRLSRLEELVRFLRGLAGVERERFLREPGIQAQAERWLHLASECALDLANHLIADRGWRTPTTYREAFEILQRENVLSRELAEQMVKWAGLRNVLVHLYLKIDHAVLYEVLTRDLDQLVDFAAAMLSAVQGGE